MNQRICHWNNVWSRRCNFAWVRNAAMKMLTSWENPFPFPMLNWKIFPNGLRLNLFTGTRSSEEESGKIDQLIPELFWGYLITNIVFAPLRVQLKIMFCFKLICFPEMKSLVREKLNICWPPQLRVPSADVPDNIDVLGQDVDALGQGPLFRPRGQTRDKTANWHVAGLRVADTTVRETCPIVFDNSKTRLNENRKHVKLKHILANKSFLMLVQILSVTFY